MLEGIPCTDAGEPQTARIRRPGEYNSAHAAQRGVATHGFAPCLVLMRCRKRASDGNDLAAELSTITWNRESSLAAAPATCSGLGFIAIGRRSAHNSAHAEQTRGQARDELAPCLLLMRCRK